jgi:hypothetical protein
LRSPGPRSLGCLLCRALYRRDGPQQTGSGSNDDLTSRILRFSVIANKCSARYTFVVVSRAIGLRPPARGHAHGRGPRLHDLRHRRAARTLVRWYREGRDVERELPKLATYLGHVHVADTYWYLEAVPELLRLATERATHVSERVL